MVDTWQGGAYCWKWNWWTMDDEHPAGMFIILSSIFFIVQLGILSLFHLLHLHCSSLKHLSAYSLFITPFIQLFHCSARYPLSVPSVPSSPLFIMISSLCLFFVHALHSSISSIVHLGMLFLFHLFHPLNCSSRYPLYQFHLFHPLLQSSWSCCQSERYSILYII